MDNKLNINTNYDDNINTENIYIDNDNNIITNEDLNITPMDVIRKLADKIGHEIKEPKSDCKKCYGRGYIGRDSKTKAPIPCSCIFVDYNNSNNIRMFEKTRKLSRKERRSKKRY